MKERLYRAIYDDGHDYGYFEYWSSYRNNSKNNRKDAEDKMIRKYGYREAKRMIIIQTYLV